MSSRMNLKDIQKLLDETTIVRVEDRHGNIIFENLYKGISRYQRNQGAQLDLTKLERFWKTKWKHLNNQWTQELLYYRLLYASIRHFYYSFAQLRFNKVRNLNAGAANKSFVYLNELTGTSLYGVYQHGKKCIDLLKALNLVQNKNGAYVSRFSETRNKLLEHNQNPYGYTNLWIEPRLFSLVSTSSFLEIQIHKSNKEKDCTVYVDYYEDYYQLETIILDIIKDF